MCGLGVNQATSRVIRVQITAWLTNLDDNGAVVMHVYILFTSRNRWVASRLSHCILFTYSFYSMHGPSRARAAYLSREALSYALWGPPSLDLRIDLG